MQHRLQKLKSPFPNAIRRSPRYVDCGSASLEVNGSRQALANDDPLGKHRDALLRVYVAARFTELSV